MSDASHLIERAAARLAEQGMPGISPQRDLSGNLGLQDAAQAPALSLSQLERAGLITESAARSRVAEELWLVQRQVLRSAFGPAARPEARANLLMVTSTRPAEGKSFVALNLAASIARQGDHQVLLVDADVKRESISDLLGLRQAPGLLDLAEGTEFDPAGMATPTEIPGLSFVSIGRARPRTADQLSRRHMSNVLLGLSRRNPSQLVILDTSPCLATSDPSALAIVVGQILFVVEAERTQRGEIESALDLLQDCPTITLLLNKMKQVSGGSGFGTYAPYYSS